MKKQSIFMVLLLASVLLPTSLLGRQKNYDVFQVLMARHYVQMQKIMQQKNLSPFFMDVSFKNEAQVKNILHQVAASRAGFMKMQYISYSNINGDAKMVNVSLIRNGNMVRVLRSTNDNGVLLKAVYDYNAQTGELKTGGFANKKQVLSAKYSI